MKVRNNEFEIIWKLCRIYIFPKIMVPYLHAWWFMMNMKWAYLQYLFVKTLLPDCDDPYDLEPARIGKQQADTEISWNITSRLVMRYMAISVWAEAIGKHLEFPLTWLQLLKVSYCYNLLILFLKLAMWIVYPHWDAFIFMGSCCISCYQVPILGILFNMTPTCDALPLL